MSTEQCLKPKWQDRCCCTCANQRKVMKHPWNKQPFSKGPMTEQAGWVCMPPVADFVIYSDTGHGLCEMWEPRQLEWNGK